MEECLVKLNTFINEMNADNSRLYKESILNKYKEDSDIKYFLNFLFSPFTVTGISSKKIEVKQMLGLPIKLYKTIQQIIAFVLKNNTGTNRIISQVQGYINDLPKEYRQLVRNLLTKDIVLGIDATTINKIMPGLIPTFDVMLAEKYFEKPEVVEGKEFTITTKIDGGRIVAIKENGNVSFYSRAGQKYEGLVDIQKELQQVPQDNFIIDGEITLLNKGDLSSKEQYKETMKITRADGEKHGVKILAFDYMPLQDFLTQTSTQIYLERRVALERDMSKLTYITILPALYVGTDTNMIIKFLEEQVNAGEEGVMININNALYDFKRTTSLLKVKKMQDVDLKVIDLEEGTGKNTNRLGSFVVMYKDNIVKVGSGISDELRIEIWNNKQKYIGQTIEVQYFEETTNGKGGLSLRFPVFKDFRYDKEGQ